MYFIYNCEGKRVAIKQAGTVEEFKQEFSENIFISENDLGENVIIEDGTIRAMTRLDKILSREESLQEGEYIKDNEIIHSEKPSEFHLWDPEKNLWTYDKELEINSLEEQLGALELEIYNKSEEVKKLKEDKKTFAAKMLEKEIKELEKLFDEKLARYDELEG